MTEALPSFVRDLEQPRPAELSRPWQWLAAIFLLVVLAVQILLADRQRLAGDANWRHLVESACVLLKCAVPPWREPQALHVTAREVRPHASASGALSLTASFINRSRFAQAWPEVQVSFSDVDGQILATRRFLPVEYRAESANSDVLDVKQTATLKLDLLDPGPSAVAFSLEFF